VLAVSAASSANRPVIIEDATRTANTITWTANGPGGEVGRWLIFMRL
jgi:hypothetical protein